MNNKLIKIIWITLIGSIIGFCLLFTAINFGIFGALPTFEDLENPNNALASEIITSDGEILGKYYIQNRSFTKFEELSPYLTNALVATEDARYYKHFGIDLRGLSRAIFFLGKKGGGSTITQQLALNLFSERAKNPIKRIIQKLQEWVIALRLEHQYTKQEILAMYLNTVEFGLNTYGIKSAAKTYFNTTTDSLNIQQSAMLIGLLKGNTIYSPVRNPQNALNRRNTVIGQMIKYKYISKSEGDSITKLDLVLDLKPQTHVSGMATYFREHLRTELLKWCSENLKSDGSKYDLYRDGLKIYTTIDSRMQRYAEESVKEHMPSLQKTFFEHWKGREPWGKFSEILEMGMKRSDRYRLMKKEGLSHQEIVAEFNKPLKLKIFSWNGWIDTTMTLMDSIKYAKHFLHTGMMAMDNETGQIKAWVGGIDIEFSQYDHVNITAKRQVGSTFKPMVYTVAIDNGTNPCIEIPNEPVTFEEFNNWTPSNYDGVNGGYMNLYKGLAMSINNIVAHLMKEVGPQAVIDLARRMGISSPMDPYPAICLGTSDMSVFEMVGAYGAYANKGVWIEPNYLLRIEDKHGNILYEKIPQTNEAMSEETAYIMTKLLQGVVTKGTAGRLRYRYQLTGDIAGKTGTTQNNSDGWFLGYTPQLTVGCWVGADDRSVSFRTTQLGGGANMALPTVGLFLQKTMNDKNLNIKPSSFTKPENLNLIDLDCNGIPDQEHKKVQELFR